MKCFSYLLCLASAAAVFVSCNTETSEGPAVISTDKTEITVDSDNLLLIDPLAEQNVGLTDTVMVSSTRSWSVGIETGDGGDWLSVGTPEYVNVSDKEETIPLVIFFDRYKGNAPRTATIKLFAADIDEVTTVSVTQKAYQPTVQLIAGEQTILPSGMSTARAIVRANTLWTAHIDVENSTVFPTLSAVSGEATGVIDLMFPTNIDDEMAKTAVLVVEADGCPAVSAEYVQMQTKSFFCLSEPVPEQVLPYIETIHIPLLSNGPWKAEISECTFANARLSSEFGTNCTGGIDFIADHGSDPGMEKQATVTISREGMEDIVVRFSQEGSIQLVVSRFDPNYEWNGDLFSDSDMYRPFVATEWPFSNVKSLPLRYNDRSYAGQVLDLLLNNGYYTFTCYGTDCGTWFQPSGVGLAVGKEKDNYIILPSVPGKRLSKMYLQASCLAGTPYTVRTEDGESIIKGGELTWTNIIIPIDGDLYDMHEHIFPETEVGARYRLNLEENLRYLSVKDICLVYE